LHNPWSHHHCQENRYIFLLPDPFLHFGHWQTLIGGLIKTIKLNSGFLWINFSNFIDESGVTSLTRIHSMFL
jgi:hypothetical protein